MNNKKIDFKGINKEIDITGIGNAIVDVIANVDDDFLAMHSWIKGTMRLIEEHDVLKLKVRNKCSPGYFRGFCCKYNCRLISPGLIKRLLSARLKMMILEMLLNKELKKLGVFFNTAKAGGADAPSTASCIVLTTPDAQRTMNTCLGIAGSIAPEDIDENIISQSKMIYIEGYLWDKDSAKSAIRKAIAVAKKSSTIIAIEFI